VRISFDQCEVVNLLVDFHNNNNFLRVYSFKRAAYIVIIIIIIIYKSIIHAH